MKKLPFRVGFSLGFACGLSILSGPAAVPHPQPAPYREHRILIRPIAGISAEHLARLHQETGCNVMAQFPALGSLQVVEGPPGQSVSNLIQHYLASGLVQYAEPDFLVHLASTFPNDPKFIDGTLWALNNAGQNGGKPNADIDAPESWEIWRLASNVVVAVVDTGVRTTHEDLASNIWSNPEDGSHGTNALAGNSAPDDDNGHGTLVAGVIGAAGNNGLGVVGVAWQVGIMACKFVDSSGNGSVSDAIACLEYAQTHGARIINASWGLDAFSLSLSNAVAAAGLAGIVVVAAAGNENRDIDMNPYYPASFALDNVVSVAATTRTDEFYPLSNFGAINVSLAAPGSEIYSTYFLSDDSYSFDEGTSLAAAFVSGSLTLLRSRFPSDTPSQLIRRLLDGVDILPGFSGLCASGGRLNLRKALGIGLPAPLLQISAASNGTTTIRLLGAPGRAYAIEQSANLAGWNAVITNLTNLDGTFIFSVASSNEFQFYRGRMAP